MTFSRKTTDGQFKGKKKIDDNPDWEQLSNESFAELSKYEHLRITPETDIPIPIPIITISGETICTEGNITTISGASKSGKSAFTGWILAGAISPDGQLNDPLEGLYVEPNTKQKAVIHFDTEQARHKQQKNIRTMLYRADLEKMPKYFLSYNIRQLATAEYTKKTGEICEAANKAFDGIHLIVVDGGADYINDVNDQEQSNGIVKFFEDLAIRYKTTVIIIIHTNPGTEKERGHLGSQCQRKSESVLIVKQDSEISYIEGKFLREAGKGKISNMPFMYAEDKGYHVGVQATIRQTVSKDEEKRGTAERISKVVFASGVGLKDGQAIEKVMKELNKAEATAKQYLKIMRAHEMIVQGDDKLWRLNPDYSV